MSATSQQNETTPLANAPDNNISKAYGLECHAKFVPCLYGTAEVISDYEPLKFSTFRALFAAKGTVFSDPIIFFEQILILIIFTSCAIPMYIYFNHEAGLESGDGPSMRKWLGEQEGRMREFAMIMTVLASLLLSFYTAMAVGRWWAMRTAGIGGIKAATVEIENVISQTVTQDPQVLSAVRRYGRASLLLIFLWRRKSLGTLKQELVTLKVLTENEADQLLKWNHDLHETLWAWQSAIVCTLWQEGKIPSEIVLRQLLERCSDGRKAVQVIHTHLAVKIPMQYVHLLCLLVKMHNLVLSIIMGTLFGAAVRNGEAIICVQLVARTFLLPLLFNAILLINAELSDPFSGNPSDFPGNAYQNALENDGGAFVKAAQAQPRWLSRRNPLPV